MKRKKFRAGCVVLIVAFVFACFWSGKIEQAENVAIDKVGFREWASDLGYSCSIHCHLTTDLEVRCPTPGERFSKTVHVCGVMGYKFSGERHRRMANGGF